MKNLFIGSSHPIHPELLTTVNHLNETYDYYIGMGGSIIVAAILACKLSREEIKLLYAGLRVLVNDYGWNQKSFLSMINDPLPRGNAEPFKRLLRSIFGIKNLLDTPLGFVAYNMTLRKIELIRKIDISVAEAVLISMSLPGYFYPTYYQNNQYIDVTPVNRFPLDIIPGDEEVYGIYIRSISETFAEEVMSAASKPWQDITPDMTIDYN